MTIDSSLSPSISKLFEMCTLELYLEVFVTTPLQFGFKKKLGTGHALFTLRFAVDYYVTIMAQQSLLHYSILAKHLIGYFT